MASLGTVKFGISYSGTTRFEDVWNISTIHILLEKNNEGDFSVDLIETTQTATQYPSFNVQRKTNFFNTENRGVIYLSPSVPKTMRLSARILRPCGPVNQLDYRPILLDSLPKFESG